MAALRNRSSRTRICVGTICVGAMLMLGACFVEPPQPAAFRFDCSSDAECSDGQVCANGLCQQHCGADNDVDCDQSSICLNGYCSNVCMISDSVCPMPQECLSLSGDTGDTGSDVGVCTVPCDNDNPCPDGQVCFASFGLCVATCMTVDDCGSGEDCLGGLCIPSSSGGGFP